MKKSGNDGTYRCDHSVEFRKSDLMAVADYRSGLPVSLDNVKEHLKKCDDSGVMQKIGKYCRENVVGHEIGTYDRVL